jgi:Tol biopolymer transport system component
MGEVFVAEDTRLHRKVAVKVLSGLVAADEERRRRFEREAQAIAAISHPNIVTIYSVEEADGVPFIVMELVEGRPLSDVIKTGGLPIDDLLRIGVAVSDAVGAAHQRGITHRDLKPANVMVGTDGRVKVLDFGLAKLREAEAEYDGETRLPTGDLTGEGRIIGTVAYMSPEQAEGKSVDPRTDIFSLGVMLHEMAVGERPFKGDTNVSIISSILKDTPSSITDLNPALPVGLAKVIRRSLAKDPSRRYQSAIDLRNELEELKQDHESGAFTRLSDTSLKAAAPAGHPRSRGAAIALGVAALAVAALGVAWYASRGRTSGTTVTFEPDRVTRITTTGVAQLAAISGDGRYIVHIKNEGVRPSLWVRQTATSSDVQIVPPADVRYDGLTFSPDGDYVYYNTYELTGGLAMLYRVPVLGGTPTRVLDDIDSRVSFSPDGRQFVFARGVPGATQNLVMIANADGSGARSLAAAVPSGGQSVAAAGGNGFIALDAPSWSPDGKSITVPARSLEEGPHSVVLVFDATSGQSRTIGGKWANLQDTVWMPDGRSFLIVAAELSAPQSQQIWQVTYPAGERHRVTVDLNNYSSVTVSNDGRTIATVQNEVNSSIWVAPATDIAKATQISQGTGKGEGVQGLAWTGDGRLVFGSRASGSPQIWISDADGRNARQVTSTEGIATSPSMPVSGDFVVFQQYIGLGLHIYRIGLNDGLPKQLTTGPGESVPTVSPDGQWVYYNVFSAGPRHAVRVPANGGSPTILDGTGLNVLGVSPDGSTLLGTAWDATARRSSLAIVPVTGGPPKLLGLPVVTAPAWAPDGKAITYIDFVDGRAALKRHDVTTGVSTLLYTFPRDRLFAFAWSPDGKRIALGRGSVSSDVVVIGRK